MLDSQKKQIYKLVGNKIGRYITEVRGLKQTDFAKDIDMNRATLSNIISGRQQASLHLLFIIAQQLKVDVSTFLPTNQEIEETLIDTNNKYNKILSEKGISENSQNTILSIINPQKGN